MMKYLLTLLLLGSVTLAQECAAEIRKLGNATTGYLMIQFDGVVRPAACGVKGTTDKQSLKGNSGIWRSGEKYPNTNVTIVMYDEAGGTLKECKYDTNGKLQVTTCFAEFVEPIDLVDNGGTVDINWFMVREQSVDHYEVERSTDDGSSYTALNQVAYTGAAAYAYTDNSPVAGAFYRVVAVCGDGKKYTSDAVQYNPR